MRNSLMIFWSAMIFSFLGNDLLAQGYLTKEGKLAQPLKIVQLQSGFVGVTGVQYSITPDGWISETILNQKRTPKNKGKLSEKELAKLGEILEKYSLTTLPQQTMKHTGANPFTLTFEFGDKKARLVVSVPPKLDPMNPAGSVESRFAGIWEGTKGLLKANP